MTILSLQNLTLRFGGLTAVNDLTIRVEQGEIFSLIGPNGAGKTSVFNAITGVYPPTTGKVLCNAREVARAFSAATFFGLSGIGLATGLGLLLAVQIETLWAATITNNYTYQETFPWIKAIKDFVYTIRELPLSESLVPLLLGAWIGTAGAWSVWNRSRRSPEVSAAAGIARTFQNIRLFQQMSVLDNVLVGMHARLKTRIWDAAFRLPLHHRERAEGTLEAQKLLAFVGLEDEAYAAAGSLSYGHQRRLEIARALATKPKLLLLDEPAAGMNPSEALELMHLIRKIRDLGITVLLIEHHMKVVMGISDRIAVLDYGNKIAEGAPEEIRKNAKVIQAYLGTEDDL